MKRWLHTFIKTVVNDCSIGMALIVIGFILGWMSQSIWIFITNLYVRIH
jgi:hypothetical protein